jgi:hypothetical protein
MNLSEIIRSICDSIRRFRIKPFEERKAPGSNCCMMPFVYERIFDISNVKVIFVSIGHWKNLNCCSLPP